MGGWEGLAAASRIVLARYGPRIDTYESVLFMSEVDERGEEYYGIYEYIRGRVFSCFCFLNSARGPYTFSMFR